MHEETILRVFRRLVDLGMSISWIANELQVDVETIESVLNGKEISVALFNKASKAFGVCSKQSYEIFSSKVQEVDVISLPLLRSPYIGDNPRSSAAYIREYPVSGEALKHISVDELDKAYLLRISRTYISPYSLHAGDIVLIVQRPVESNICGIVLVNHNGIPRLARLMSSGNLECLLSRDILYGAVEVGVCVGVVWRCLAYSPEN